MLILLLVNIFNISNTVNYYYFVARRGIHSEMFTLHTCPGRVPSLEALPFTDFFTIISENLY